MPVDEAKAIYHARYWMALRCDEFPPGLDYALFDYGVNSGTSRAAKVLQRILGLPVDGRVTENEIAAARRHFTADLINRICDERLAFLQSLKTWPVFGKGWRRRVGEVRAAALAMAGDAPRLPNSDVSPGRTRESSGSGIVDLLSRLIAFIRRAS